MTHNVKRKVRGFTLIEILIVVIILGILAAIVIPQFTNASQNARQSSVQSTLQTIRSQIELFKLNHSDTPPQNASQLWSIMTTKSSTADVATAVGSGTAFGPYLQQAPVNPLANATSVTGTATSGYGWFYTTGAGNAYTVYAIDASGAQMTSY